MTFEIVSYGGGTNSKGLLVGLHERGERPAAITFADTGDEKPHTYRDIEEMREWCARVGFPDISVVRGYYPQQVKDGSLYAECVRLGSLPSKAFGGSHCSLKWKIEPQRRFDKEFAAEHGIGLRDITRLIGFDADEPHRAARAEAMGDKRPTAERFPLIEWELGAR